MDSRYERVVVLQYYNNKKEQWVDYTVLQPGDASEVIREYLNSNEYEYRVLQRETTIKEVELKFDLT